jgi:hypothetical protein
VAVAEAEAEERLNGREAESRENRALRVDGREPDGLLPPAPAPAPGANA